MSGKQVAGGIIIFLAFISIFGGTGLLLYFFFKWQRKQQPQTCNNGKISFPAAVTCKIEGDYNIYPGSIIGDTGLKTVFDGVKTYNPKATKADTSPPGPAIMNQINCSQLCTDTTGCVAFAATILDPQKDPTACSCTGYSDVPSTLKQDTTDACKTSSKCTSVGIMTVKIK